MNLIQYLIFHMARCMFKCLFNAFLRILLMTVHFNDWSFFINQDFFRLICKRRVKDNKKYWNYWNTFASHWKWTEKLFVEGHFIRVVDSMGIRSERIHTIFNLVIVIFLFESRFSKVSFQLSIFVLCYFFVILTSSTDIKTKVL